MSDESSHGFPCSVCDAEAPLSRDGLFLYLTHPESEERDPEPSCTEHALLRLLPSGNYVPTYALAV